MMIGCPPSAAMPASNERRVRVEGFSKMTATDFGPSRGRETKGSFFIRSASSRIAACSSAVMSSSTRKWRGWGALNAGLPFSRWRARSCRRLRSAGDVGDPRKQLGDTERLREDRLLTEDLLHRRHGVDLAGDDDDGNISECRVAAELFQDADATEIGHHQVEK